MQQSLLFPGEASSYLTSERKGAVYTKPQVVDLLLDLSAYFSCRNLVDSVALEPAAGEGAFLVEMVRRVVASCRRQNRPLSDCRNSILAYEINAQSAQTARSAIVSALQSMSVPIGTAVDLANHWIRIGDFLCEASRLPVADYVFGNPPYVRLEDMPVKTIRFYRDLYPTMRGRADLYVAFFEASLRLLKPNGVCAFICADRWMRNQYGTELRRLVTSEFSVDLIVEMHDAGAFAVDVSAYPALTILRRAKQGRTVVARTRAAIEAIDMDALTSVVRAAAKGEAFTSSDGFSAAPIDGWFSGVAPWPCGSPKRLALLRRLETQFAPLESERHQIRVGIGVATGCDDVFITKDPTIVEHSRLLPLAMAMDIAPGRLQWSGHYLIDPWDREGLVKSKDYPRLQAYFAHHRDALSRRHTAQKNPQSWYRTIDRVNHSLLTKPKLYIHDITDRFNPVLDFGTTYPHHNLYFIQSDVWDLEVLGALLLSDMGQLFIDAYGVRMRGGYLRFQAQYLRRVRLPDRNSIMPDHIRQLVRAFRERDRQHATEVAHQLYHVDPVEMEAEGGY